MQVAGYVMRTLRVVSVDPAIPVILRIAEFESEWNRGFAVSGVVRDGKTVFFIFRSVDFNTAEAAE